MFSLLPLGTNGLYPTKESPTSGYLVTYNGVNILIDIGSGVFTKLCEVMPPENLDAVIISHYHFDHVSDIGVLSYYLQTRNKKLTVYGPNDNSPYQSLISGSPYFNYMPIDENSILDFKEFNVSFCKMKHPVLTYGVRLSDGEKVLSYSSDSALCGGFEKLLSNCNLAVLDCGFTYDNWNEDKPLISAKHVGLLAKSYGVKTMLLSHFNPTIPREKLAMEGQYEYENCKPIEHKRYYL